MRLILFIMLVFACSTIQAQYRFDNAAFKTVYWDELCQALKQNPDHLLLDVRSKGEHYDTSTSKTLNIGHLKGALNIDIREVGNRLKELEAHKNKPIFVYCSHSQRSRRVSKMLADSGFLNVININGGVSNLHMANFDEECELLTSNVPYQILSPKAISQNIINEHFVLDVRPDSSFKGIAVPDKKNAYGKFRSSVNIPLASLEEKLVSIPKDKKILIVDETGNESVAAAELLQKNGFSNLTILFNGLDAYLNEVPENERKMWTSAVPYHTINGVSFDQLMKKNTAAVIDIRTADEFNNASKESFRNMGTIKGALNIPFANLDQQYTSLPSNKETPVVVYASGSSNEVFETAKRLSAQGYKNVTVLLGGLFNFRWRAANIKGQQHLKDWVVNVPAENQ